MALVLLLAVALSGCSKGGSGTGPTMPMRFTRLSSTETGVSFVNRVEENPVMNGLTYEYYYNGGGVAVGDLDGDGLPDLYFTGNQVPNKLFLNRGDLHFEDVTDRAGVPGQTGWATGVTFADVNGDGRLDIYVCYSGAYDDPDLRRNLLYINQGVRDGVPRFTEEAAAYGLDDRAMSNQAVFFDADGDGDLDMYLMNHGVAGYETMSKLKAGHSPLQVDRLYRNDGGHFVDVTARSGLVDTNLGFGLGVTVADLNNDGYPDIYVGNDYSGRDYLYLGQPGGRFRDVATEAMGHTPYASMGLDVADVDGDGWLDVMTLEMNMPTHYGRVTSDLGTHGARFDHVVAEGQGYQYAENAFQWNRGRRADGVPAFSEIANVLGITATDWSWGPLLADFDNDGRPDLFISNGILRDMINSDFRDYREIRTNEVVAKEGHVTESLVRDLLSKQPRRKVRNRIFHNDGDLRFTERTDPWGLGQASYSNGAVYADLDRDGDLDLVVNNLMGEAFVYRNEAQGQPDHHWLELRLDGPRGNRFAVGARVRLVAGGAQQVQELQPTRGYLSSVEPVLHFGLGAAATVDTLQVTWPGGAQETLSDLAADRLMTLTDSSDRTSPKRTKPAPPRLPFSDASALLEPTPIHEAPPLPPDSALRPYPTRRGEVALAVTDVDADGRPDFFFAGSGTQPSRIYLQRPDGTFRGRALPELDHSGERITAAVFFDANGDGRPDLWVVSTDTSPTEQPVTHHRLYMDEGGGRFAPAPGNVVPDDLRAAGSALAPGDFDGDGDIDLFVGDRIDPDDLLNAGRPLGSRLLVNDGGVFHDATREVAPELDSLRTVTDALWADANGDGAPDLVVAGEWMPVTVLVDDRGHLRDATREAGLDSLSGWWQSLAAGDFDGDGDIDLVAGNVGLDYPYHPTVQRPFSVYLGDFDGDGKVEAVPAFFESDTLFPWYYAARMTREIPSIAKRFPTNHLYGLATLQDILGRDALDSSTRLSVSTLASMYLRNDGGGHFQAIPLPRPAQISPIRAAVASDLDGDGKLDLVVAGNLYELDSTAERADAGVGLFLRGDGKGGFAPLMPQESGLLLPGRVVRMLALPSGAAGSQGLLVGFADGAARYVRVDFTATPSG